MKAWPLLLGAIAMTNGLCASSEETLSFSARSTAGDPTIRLTLMKPHSPGATEHELRQSELRVLQSYAVQLRAQLAALPESEPQRAFVLRQLAGTMRRVNELIAGLPPRGSLKAP